MKKGLYAILAALTVFALVMTGCPAEDDSGSSSSVDKVRITFNAGEGVTVTPASKEVEKGKAAGALPTPAKDGFTFVGWATTADAATPDFTAATVVNGTITVYAIWSADVSNEPIPVEELSLANAWFAIYEIKLPAGKKWSDYKQQLTVDYKLDEANYLGGTPRAVRAMGNYLPVEVANPTLGVYTPDGGTAVNIATVGDWPGGTSNDWIMSQIGSSWDPGKIPEVLADWTLPAGTDIVKDTWFTIWYPVNGEGVDVDGKTGKQGAPNATWNLTGVRKPADNDTGPFYFGVGIPGAGTANTFQVTNVTLKGNAAADDAVGRPLYYSNNGRSYRALAGHLDKDADGNYTNVNGGNPGWKIISGDTGIVTKPITTIETVQVKFDLNYTPVVGTPPAALTINKGAMLTNSQLSPIALRQGYKLDGWFTAATGGTQITNPTYKIFTDAETTFYAHWTALPNATTDYTYILAGDGKTNIASFGGIGDLNNDAGVGPFEYKEAQAYDAAIWFPYASVINDAIYSKIVIVVHLKPIDSSGLPMKLAVHNGRAVNTWSGGTPTYFPPGTVTATAEGDYTIELPVASTGIILQHNTYRSPSTGPVESADFELTVKSITLVKP